MSRLEELEGWRWAKDTILSVKQSTKGWKESLIKTLEWGLVEKPEGYRAGVSRGIEIVRACPEVHVAVETDND